MRSGHAPAILLLEEVGQTFLDTLALAHGLPIPGPGPLSERAAGLSARNAAPGLDAAGFDGLRRIDRAATSLRRPHPERLLDIAHRSSPEVFCELDADLASLHRLVCGAIGWPVGSGD